MRIIDAHVHNWSVFADPKVLIQALDRFAIDWVVLLSDLTGGPYPAPEEVTAANERTLALMRRCPERIIGFAYLNPAYPKHAGEELRRCFEAGMMGVKLWVATKCNDPQVFPVVEAAIELGMPLVVHTWNKITGNLPHESRPTDLADLARRYPEARFQMAHIGGDWEFGCKAIRDCPQVKVDFAGTVNEWGAYEMALRELGEDRIVFGTDMPADYHLNLGRVLQGNYPEEVKQKILADNFEALLPRPLPH
ncbi:MAG TPA: amidohydrolase [Armatimonadetes bacterium]|nr:amidohydrolase [Armatimonadota bacterium]